MTKVEAAWVANIACGADGECHVCAQDLIKQLASVFPDHAETFWRQYKVNFDMTDDDLEELRAAQR